MKLEWNMAAQDARKRRKLSAAAVAGFVDPSTGAEQAAQRDQGAAISRHAAEEGGAAPPGTPAGAEPAQEGGAVGASPQAAQVARLREEGNAFAEEGSYGKALSRWDAALALDPCQAVLQEQRAQVLLELGNPWPAVQAATRATELEPSWGTAWVTLARAQLNYGEPAMAVRSLQNAVRLQAGDLDVLKELQHAQSLVVHQHLAGRESAMSRFLPGLTSLHAQMPTGRGGGPAGTCNLSQGTESRVLDLPPSGDQYIGAEEGVGGGQVGK